MNRASLKITGMTALLPLMIGANITVAEETGKSGFMELEEIVVTARKREEGLQNTPISITAVSSEGLEKRQIISMDQVSNITPNLTINTSSAFSGSSQTPAVFLRGIGQTDFTLNTDPGVGIYVDGVYISRSVGALLDLVDVERVEILRGPQGTLFGRNTIGGSISITSNKPSDDFSGNAKVTIGSDNWLVLSGNISLPISDSLKAKITIQNQDRDGYVTRTADGIKLGDDNSTSFRGALLWTPTEKLSFYFVGDYTTARENGAPLSLTKVNEAAPFVAIHNIFVAPGLVPTMGNGAFYNAQYVTGNLYETAGTEPVFSDLDVWGLMLTAEYQGDMFDVKSITSYRNLDSKFSRDGDGSPLKINATANVFTYDQFSQEVQFLGRGLNDRMNWILGLYYFEESGDDNNTVDFGYIKFRSGGAVKNKSYAAFFQTTYDVTDKLSVTGGLRYTDETKKFNPVTSVLVQRVPLPVPPFPPFLNFTNGQLLVPQGQVETGVGKWTPMINLAYQWTEGLMTYGTFSQGFKSGGFTQRIFPALTAVPSFNPETVNVYEAGFKYSGLEGRMRLNGSAYYTDYANLQVTVQIGVAPTTQNAAQAEIKGFELEMQLIPVERMQVDLGIGYIDAKYTALDNQVVGISLNSKLPGTSEWTLNGAVSYVFDIGNSGTLTPRLDWSYRSEFFFDANNTMKEDGYHLLNASMMYDYDDNWRITFFVKNLTNKTYFTHGESILDPAGFALVTPSRKREWGITLSTSF
ncbi:MAG: TonB-dependent receptor [Alphaproteobacteria bacterium]|nr:TonB-dependent receptor [Alphaproteobacteria bacterium]